ncbi:trypsin-like serine peptidase [Citrobacter freundii]|uniref:trypsin-like serine peptidase n=1 Tax=Citrobacter freundii TaxID=546 RepID=UPI001BCD0D16|nr:trypsin-like serine protease [Citrobacter freundii]
MSRCLKFIAIVLVMLSGCSGFEVEPPPDNQIQFVRNTNNLLSDKYPTTFRPVPILLIPDSKVDALKRVPNVRAPDVFQPSLTGADGALHAQAVGDVTRADEHTPPFDAFAKLRFTKAGSGWQCTAEFVGDSNDVLLTAGHCVFDNDMHIWHSNFRTLVRYNSGISDLTLNWECAAIYSGWINGVYSRDYAFIKLRGASDKALGIRAGSTPTATKSVGYPSNYFGGEQLAQVDGTISNGGSGTVRMANNPFGPGSSGGAWLDANSVAVGLNSFRPTSDTGAMWGPQFDADTILLYNFVKAGCNSGVSASRAAFKALNSPSMTVVEQDIPSIKSPIYLTNSPSDKCACEGAQAVNLINESASSYLVEFQVNKFGQSERLETRDQSSVLIGPGRSELLACTHSAELGQSCDIESSVSLMSTSRVLNLRDKLGTLSVQSVSPEFCAEKCTNGSAGYCLPLGSGAAPIVKSLSIFLTSSLNRPPINGVVATIPEMISSFGGDPDKIGNPCSRSSFYRDGVKISNDGANCRVTTKVLESGPNALRLSLVSSTQSFAVASSTKVMAPKAKSAEPDRTLFPDRTKAPVFEFHGPKNEDELNATFGGVVTSVEKIGDKLVLTTENGCSVGDVSKP